jgi:hypothetical protein
MRCRRRCAGPDDARRAEAGVSRSIEARICGAAEKFDERQAHRVRYAPRSRELPGVASRNVARPLRAATRAGGRLPVRDAPLECGLSGAVPVD